MPTAIGAEQTETASSNQTNESFPILKTPYGDLSRIIEILPPEALERQKSTYTPLSPEVKQLLGWSDEDVNEKHEALRVKQEEENKLFKQLYERGYSAFLPGSNILPNKIEDIIPHRTLQVTANNRRDYPDALKNALELAIPIEEGSVEFSQSSERLRAYLRGYAEHALLTYAMEEVANALDIGTPGGIQNDQETIRRIDRKLRLSPDAQLSFAKAIQERLDKRKQIPTDRIPSEQKPVPEFAADDERRGENAEIPADRRPDLRPAPPLPDQEPPSSPPAGTV